MMLKSLSEFRLIIPSRPHTVHMLVDSRLAALGLKPQVAPEVDGVRAMLDLVQRGYGFAVLAGNALLEAGDGTKLVARPVVRPTLRGVMAVATSAQRPLTRMAQNAASLLQ